MTPTAERIVYGCLGAFILMLLVVIAKPLITPGPVRKDPELRGYDPKPGEWSGNPSYPDRLASIQRYVSETGRNRFSVAWNPAAPTAFQGADNMQVVSRGNTLIVISLDDGGTPVAGTWFYPERLTVAAGVMKTVVTVGPFGPTPAEGEHPCVAFTRRLLVGLEACISIRKEMGSDDETVIRGPRAGAFLSQLYADPASVAVLPSGERIRLERRGLAGGTEIVGVYWRSSRLMNISTQTDGPETQEQHLNTFGWVFEPKPVIPRPKMAALVDHLVNAGLPFNRAGQVSVQPMRCSYERMQLPLRHSFPDEETNLEDYFQVVGHLRIMLTIGSPASMERQSVKRDDHILLAKHFTRGGPDSVVVNLRRQSWSVSYQLTLHGDDLRFAQQSQATLEAIEADERRKWEKKLTPHLISFMESLLAAKQ